jgi:hypothetical protein
VKNVAKKNHSITPWLAAFLSFLLLLTAFVPMGAGVVSAAGGITLTGFPTGVGTQTNPHINYDSKITLSGIYGGGIVGENLRLRITSNNGQTVEDLSSTKPVVDSTNFTFTFKDVSLKPGLNVIAFYESTGDVTKDLLSFYAQYNNTPVLSDIKFNSTALTSDPTVVEISSLRNLTLAMSGKAVNADTVKVVNNTTKQTFTDDVSQSGSFSVDVDTQVGLNELDIHAYNKNKEVSLLKRSIIVTVSGSGQGGSDQYYDVDVLDNAATPNKLIDLDPNQTPTLVTPSGANTYNVKGFALINVPPNIEIFKKVDPADPNKINTIDDRLNTLILRDTTVTAEVYATPTYTKIADLSGNYKQYQVDATFSNITLTDGHTYELEHTYKYVESTTTGGITTKTDKVATIANYKYKFTYVASNSPRFGTIKNVLENNQTIVTGTTPNIVRVSPLQFEVNTYNMVNSFQLFYNDSLTPLVAGTDYVQDTTSNPYRFTLLKMPPGETKVTLKYTGGGSNPSVNFVIKPVVTPFVQMSYTDAAGTHYVDTGLQFTDLSQVPQLAVSVTNYTYSSGVKVIVNDDGDDSNTSDEITPSSVSGNTFVITSAALQAKLKEGSNVMKIKLLQAPNAVFSYTFLLTTEKAPKIENLQLKVEQNGKTVPLAKKSTESAYKTTSYFLSEFSFDVKDAKNVTIKKNGKTIADYTFNSGTNKWELNASNQEYVNNRNDATQGDTTLNNIFDNRNFPETAFGGNTFGAKMTSREYGDDLLDRLVDLKLSSEDLEARLKLFPLTLAKGGTTSYEIIASDGNVVTRQTINVAQETFSWQVLTPAKSDNAAYATVNTNSVLIRIFAENATKITFGKTEAVARNTTQPDFKYDEKLGKSLPETYYVFEATVPLKPGLNKVKYTVEVGANKFNDEVQIYNVNSSVSGAESRDLFGKKLSFSVFDKALQLKFPTGTVLLKPSNNRQGNEVNLPQNDIFTDVPLYFAIADRTNGRVLVEDDGIEDDMEDLLQISSDFNYASPLYYIDAGNADDDEKAPGGRDPYYEGKDPQTGYDQKPFIDRWRDNLVPSKQGTITIKYDPSIVNAANNILTIFYNNGEEWMNLGGVVNTGSKTITVPFKGFGYYMVMKTRESFSDIIKHPFARDALETLYAKGIMNDAPGNGFGTELKINRGEFATMIVKALDLPINAGPYRDNNERDPAEPTFRDVDPSDDDWDYEYKYIETAARAGIIRGKDTRSFYPEDSLTREEAAVIIARAMNLKLGTPEAAKLALGKMYTDAQLMDHYTTPSVLAVSKAKIMTGEANDPSAKKPTYRFNPKGDLTRAEMAVITLRIMQQLKKLPKQ